MVRSYTDLCDRLSLLCGYSYIDLCDRLIMKYVFYVSMDSSDAKVSKKNGDPLEDIVQTENSSKLMDDFRL